MTSKFARRVGIAAAPIVAAGFAFAGVSVAGSNEPSPPKPNPSMTPDRGKPGSYTAATRSRGVPLSVDAAAQRVMDGLGRKSPVKDITGIRAKNGTKLAVTISDFSDTVGQVWFSELAAGAIAELTATDQTTVNQAIVAVSAGDATGGSLTDLGVGAVRLGQDFNSPDDSVLLDRVSEVAKRFGLQTAEVEVLHPLDSALDVTFVVPEGAKVDWTVDQLRAALLGDPMTVEGALISLQTPSGQPLLQSGVAYRTGSGGLWFAPGADDRFGAVHGVRPGS